MLIKLSGSEWSRVITALSVSYEIYIEKVENKEIAVSDFHKIYEINNKIREQFNNYGDN